MSSSENLRRQDLRFEWKKEKRVFSVEDSPITVGRLNRCEVTIISPLVSRKHLSLAWSEGKWRVTDTSANGAFGIQKMPKEWDLDSSVKLHLGATDGPQLSITPIKVYDDADAGENNDGDEVLGSASSVAATVERSRNQIVDVRDEAKAAGRSSTPKAKPVIGAKQAKAMKIEKLAKVGGSKEPAIVAKSAVTQPITDTQARPTFPRTSAFETDELTSDEGPLWLKDSDAGLAKSAPSTSDSSSIDQLDLSEPAVTGNISPPTSDLPASSSPDSGRAISDSAESEMDLEAQVTGQVQLPNDDSLAYKVRAATVVIASAFVAFVAWSLFELLT